MKICGSWIWKWTPVAALTISLFPGINSQYSWSDDFKPCWQHDAHFIDSLLIPKKTEVSNSLSHSSGLTALALEGHSWGSRSRDPRSSFLRSWVPFSDWRTSIPYRSCSTASSRRVSCGTFRTEKSCVEHSALMQVVCFEHTSWFTVSFTRRSIEWKI